MDPITPFRNDHPFLSNFYPFAFTRMGRNVSLRPGWDHIWIALMHELLAIKFSGPNLHDPLPQLGMLLMLVRSQVSVRMEH